LERTRQPQQQEQQKRQRQQPTAQRMLAHLENASSQRAALEVQRRQMPKLVQKLRPSTCMVVCVATVAETQTLRPMIVMATTKTMRRRRMTPVRVASVSTSAVPSRTL
jgi:hypothetical protein